MHLKLITPPAYEPVALADVKALGRVTIPDDDAMITALTMAARQACEGYTRRAFVAQQWVASWDGIELLPYIMPFPSLRAGWPSELPFPTLRAGMPTVLKLGRSPGIGINTIYYYTMTANAQTVYASSNYYLDNRNEPPRVALVNGSIWPTDLREVDALEIWFSTGYLTPFTANYVAGTITMVGRAPVNGESFVLSTQGTADILPGGLALNTTYYVVNVNGQSCQLSLTLGGAPVAMTSNGTGAVFFAGAMPPQLLQAVKMMAVYLYEQRGDGQESTVRVTNVEVGAQAVLPKPIEILLAPFKVWRV